MRGNCKSKRVIPSKFANKIKLKRVNNTGKKRVPFTPVCSITKIK